MFAIHVRDDDALPIAPRLIGWRRCTIFSWLNEAWILHVRLTIVKLHCAAYFCRLRGETAQKAAW
jgi:hypothetical protein